MGNPYRGMRDCQVCCAWIDPSGKAYHLSDKPGLGSHGGLAENLLDDPDRGRGLEDRGFLHLSYGWVMYADRTRPTQAQLDAVWDILTELKRRKAVAAISMEQCFTQLTQKEAVS